MTLLVALVALTVFIAFAYSYMQESRLPELLERHQNHQPLSPRTLHEFDKRFRDLDRNPANAQPAAGRTPEVPADEPVSRFG